MIRYDQFVGPDLGKFSRNGEGNCQNLGSPFVALFLCNSFQKGRWGGG